MDNQHRAVSGYRELNQAEIDKMNGIKKLAEDVGELVEKLKAEGPAIDQRWVSIGATDLQKGFMSLVRSVAKPTTF